MKNKLQHTIKEVYEVITTMNIKKNKKTEKHTIDGYDN